MSVNAFVDAKRSSHLKGDKRQFILKPNDLGTQT